MRHFVFVVFVLLNLITLFLLPVIPKERSLFFRLNKEKHTQIWAYNNTKNVKNGLNRYPTTKRQNKSQNSSQQMESEWHDSSTRFTDSLLICSYFRFMQPTRIDDPLNPNSYWKWHLRREHSFVPLLLTHQIIMVICHFWVTATLSFPPGNFNC